MIDNLPPIKVFAGTKSQYMAEEICRDLGVDLGKMNIQYFADGESADAKCISYNPLSPTPTI